VFSVKGVEELVSEFASRGDSDGFMSCMIAPLYFGTIYALEKLGNTVSYGGQPFDVSSRTTHSQLV
jgi:boron transporter